MVYRSSWSQNWKYSRYPRMWFYEKVLKIQMEQDLYYANGGTTIHSCGEKFYKGILKDFEMTKKEFDTLWIKFGMNKSELSKKKEFTKDDYWNMVINQINLALPITETELKIYFSDVVGYIDLVSNVNIGIYLGDWKSSRRSKENEYEYKQQLLFYAYLYHRKYGILPKECSVYYLRYIGPKGELKIIPTMEDIEKIEQWHWKLNKEMEQLQLSKKCPSRCEECNIFCLYKDICNSEETNTMNYKLILKGNNIKIDGAITPVLKKGLENKYSYELKDAFFIKKYNPNANTIVDFFNNKTRTLPIGFYHGIIKTLTDYGNYKKGTLVLNIEDQRVFDTIKLDMVDEFVDGKVLRNYQQKAVQRFLEKKIGILQLATGAGKTLIACELIKKLGMKTLFVVDKIELMNQTIKTLKCSLGVEAGKIGQGKKDIKDITVATIQTLNKKLPEYRDYLSSVRFVIMDECHKVASKSFLKLSRYLKNTEFRLGLSATPHRSDGNDMAIHSVVGYPIYKIDSNDLIKMGYLTKPTINFIKYKMSEHEQQIAKGNSLTGLINEEEQYSLFYPNFIMNNKQRNNIIKNIVKTHKNKKILILVKLVEHGNMIAKELNVSYLNGSTKKSERRTLMNDFANGDLNILIGTVSIFSEGIDIPSLDILINATANRGDVKSIQMLGRIMRLFQGKENAIYYDFIDYHNFFKKASAARMRIFKKESHKVNVIEESNPLVKSDIFNHNIYI